MLIKQLYKQKCKQWTDIALFEVKLFDNFFHSTQKIQWKLANILAREILSRQKTNCFWVGINLSWTNYSAICQEMFCGQNLDFVSGWVQDTVPSASRRLCKRSIKRWVPVGSSNPWNFCYQRLEGKIITLLVPLSAKLIYLALVSSVERRKREGVKGRANAELFVLRVCWGTQRSIKKQSTLAISAPAISFRGLMSYPQDQCGQFTSQCSLTALLTRE